MDEKIQTLGTVIQEKTRSYAFVAHRTSNFKLKDGNINYEAAYLNADGAFNADTGFFTAPVKGIYFFSFNGLVLPVYTSKRTKFLAQMVEKKFIDGKRTYVAGAMIDTSSNVEVHLIPNSMKTSYISVSMHASVLLNKGDSVGVQLVDGWLHAPVDGRAGSRMNTFTGFLVEARE